MEKNIKDFNKFTAMLFERLYDSFPNQIVISIEDMDDGADRETIRTYASTMEFLAIEGFIRYSTTTMSNVYLNVTLTAKGLTILNKIPSVLKEKKTFIEMIKEIAKDGSKTMLHSVIDALLRESIR